MKAEGDHYEWFPDEIIEAYFAKFGSGIPSPDWFPVTEENKARIDSALRTGVPVEFLEPGTVY